MVNNFNCRGFGPLLEDKLCLIFKLAPSVCRMTFPILASLLVRLVVLLPFQLLRLSLATLSRWTPLALSVFLHCVVSLLSTLLYPFLLFMSFLACQIGRLITISTTPVIAGDSFEMDAVGALRLSPLRRGLAIDSTVDIFTFYVPHRHVYGEQWIKFMKDGVNATPLPTVNTTGY